MRSNKGIILWPIIICLIASFTTSCRPIDDINITGIKNISLKGLNKNIINLSLDLEIDNPNNRKITVTEVQFNAWLNNRELGTMRSSENIVILPCSKSTYPIQIDVELRTIADALRLFTTPTNNLLSQIEVEGFIKGRSFPIRKKIDIPRQPFTSLTKSQ